MERNTTSLGTISKVRDDSRNGLGFPLLQAHGLCFMSQFHFYYPIRQINEVPAMFYYCDVLKVSMKLLIQVLDMFSICLLNDVYLQR